MPKINKSYQEKIISAYFSLNKNKNKVEKTKRKNIHLVLSDSLTVSLITGQSMNTLSASKKSKTSPPASKKDTEVFQNLMTAFKKKWEEEALKYRKPFETLEKYKLIAIHSQKIKDGTGEEKQVSTFFFAFYTGYARETSVNTAKKELKDKHGENWQEIVLAQNGENGQEIVLAQNGNNMKETYKTMQEKEKEFKKLRSEIEEWAENYYKKESDELTEDESEEDQESNNRNHGTHIENEKFNDENLYEPNFNTEESSKELEENLNQQPNNQNPSENNEMKTPEKTIINNEIEEEEFNFDEEDEYIDSEEEENNEDYTPQSISNELITDTESLAILFLKMAPLQGKIDYNKFCEKHSQKFKSLSLNTYIKKINNRNWNHINLLIQDELTICQNIYNAIEDCTSVEDLQKSELFEKILQGEGYEKNSAAVANILLDLNGEKENMNNEKTEKKESNTNGITLEELSNNLKYLSMLSIMQWTQENKEEENPDFGSFAQSFSAKFGYKINKNNTGTFATYKNDLSNKKHQWKEKIQELLETYPAQCKKIWEMLKESESVKNLIKTEKFKNIFSDNNDDFEIRENLTSNNHEEELVSNDENTQSKLDRLKESKKLLAMVFLTIASTKKEVGNSEKYSKKFNYDYKGGKGTLYTYNNEMKRSDSTEFNNLNFLIKNCFTICENIYEAIKNCDSIDDFQDSEEFENILLGKTQKKVSSNNEIRIENQNANTENNINQEKSIPENINLNQESNQEDKKEKRKRKFAFFKEVSNTLGHDPNKKELRSYKKFKSINPNEPKETEKQNFRLFKDYEEITNENEISKNDFEKYKNFSNTYTSDSD